MAGNKMSYKTKVGKMKNNQQDDENNTDIDFAVLRKPIMTSTTGFARAKKIFDLATEELRELMGNECDLLYECKVCRNIFRSLPNFISHKRVYCKEKFDQRSHGHFMTPAALSTELQKIQILENNYKESLNSNQGNDNSDDERIPMSKDLTMVIEKLTKVRGVTENKDGVMLKLQKIPSSSAAVFQNINLENDDEGSNNSMRSQVLELDSILSQDQATLQSDGTFVVGDPKVPNVDGVASGRGDVIHISDDEDDTARLTCKICNNKFSTAKTLRFHMKYKHEESRLVFPCPDCLDIFSNSWSVYRHLFKVHRKTAAQIRRLRESIQAKAFKMNNPPAFYERRKQNVKTNSASAISEEERLERENQAWMTNMESDGSGPRCGGCGRSFERRAALLAHTAQCGARGKALARAKRIEIQIRKDYNKGPEKSIPVMKKDDANNTKLGQDENAQCSFNKNEEKKVLEEAKMFIDNEEQNSNSEDKESSCSPAETPEKTEVIDTVPIEFADKPKIKLLFTMQAEKLAHNLRALKQTIATRMDADIENFSCKRCEVKCKGLSGLCDHMAGHYGWMRYSCKLCNYKNYHFDKLAEHVKVVHKLKGDTDFYYSTVKAIDGTEAAEMTVEKVESGARRFSSDSSRLSDDSSNSSARIDLNKKRKLNPGRGKQAKKKNPIDKDEADNAKGSELTMDKVIQDIYAHKEEEDVEISRKQVDITSAPYRRPVRNKTKRKNEDFEYDLSNLLKMEAQGYRDSQTGITTPKVTAPTVSTAKVPRKKSLPDANSPLNNDIMSRNFSGALLTMSKKSVEVSGAHMLPYDMSVFKNQSKEIKLTPFARPLIPKFASTSEKLSLKRAGNQEEKLEEGTELEILNVGAKPGPVESDATESSVESKTQKTPSKVNGSDSQEGKDEFIPAMVPIKFRKESMEVMKSPIINKSLTDFSKAGMKTKILVIKPMNKSTESIQRLKFQRIKLKDPNKDDSKSDKIMLVKVPPVVVQKSETENDDKNTENCEIDSNKVQNNNDEVNGDCNGVPHEETVIDNETAGATEVEVDSDVITTETIILDTIS